MLFPDLATGDLSFVLFEPEGGVLRAAAAVRALVVLTVSAGGRVVPGVAGPTAPTSPWTGGACAPTGWCGPAGPGCRGCSPAWSTSWSPSRTCCSSARRRRGAPRLPTWVDYDGAAYGLGDLDGHGVKACPDVEGEEFDPEDGRRELSPVNERRARDYLRRRSPPWPTRRCWGPARASTR